MLIPAPEDIAGTPDRQSDPAGASVEERLHCLEEKLDRLIETLEEQAGRGKIQP